MGRLKVVYCKLGTMPARLNFRRAYAFRLNQYVYFREVDSLGQANAQWYRGMVRREYPLLISRE